MEMCEQLLKSGYKIEPTLAFEDYKEADFRRSYPEYQTIKCNIVHPNMSQIQEFYKESYLTYIPTRYSEGTSLSAIEAMSTGCPVIVSDVGGLGNIVLPGFNGFVVSPSVKEFVNVSKTLLKNPELRNELSRNCSSMNRIFGKQRWEMQVLAAIKDFL